jgi:hypothetical protein
VIARRVASKLSATWPSSSSRSQATRWRNAPSRARRRGERAQRRLRDEVHGDRVDDGHPGAERQHRDRDVGREARRDLPCLPPQPQDAERHQERRRQADREQQLPRDAPANGVGKTQTGEERNAAAPRGATAGDTGLDRGAEGR